MTRIPYSFARENALVVDEGTCLFTKTTTPTALAEVQRVLGAAPRFRKVSETVVSEAQKEIYRDSAVAAAGAAQQASDERQDSDLSALADTAASVDDLLDQNENAPVIRLINALLLEAIRSKASDVHVEVEETNLVVRFRIDGMLREALNTTRSLAPQLISRIKVMGRLDIAEKRLPQDGRVSLRVGEYHLDARISTIPTQHGERVVMRLLDRDSARTGVSALGMIGDMQQKFEGLLQRQDGMILVTGPTGSGKTTTLYAGLERLNERQRNIMTIEDPIEYSLPGVSQMQVNVATNLTFARGLRALLRQDPNVIMVGEIRDQETARIAVESAMTGHLVLSTLHTNNAIGSVARLIDLGVERFLLAPVLRGLMAQRLVRRVCKNCAVARGMTHAEAAMLGGVMAEGETVHHGAGCDRCEGSGFQGRIALYDLIEVSGELERLIAEGASEAQLLAALKGQGTGLLADGVEKIRQGLTTPGEVALVVMHDAGRMA